MIAKHLVSVLNASLGQNPEADKAYLERLFGVSAKCSNNQQLGIVNYQVYREGEGVWAFQVYLKVDTEIPDDEDEMFDLLFEYCGVLRELVKGVEVDAGKPDFHDGSGHENFPEDYDAVFLALWRKFGFDLVIMVQLSDSDGPLLLSVVVDIFGSKSR